MLKRIGIIAAAFVAVILAAVIGLFAVGFISGNKQAGAELTRDVLQTTQGSLAEQTTQGSLATQSSLAEQTTQGSLAEQTTAFSVPVTTEEIIKQYTLLVNKLKQEKPAYKKLEYQSLPKEYQNFGSAVNFLLGIASSYMVSEEDAVPLVRSAGSGDILTDVPISGTSAGCVLTDYSMVEWAKCEAVGDGTYKISFSLKRETNPEPTPAATLVPLSAHGAVMQPISRTDLTNQVNDAISGVPGISLNDFNLYFGDCVFSCVYEPETNRVRSITYNIVIDIEADFSLFISDIKGTARLLDDIKIYDIVW